MSDRLCNYCTFRAIKRQHRGARLSADPLIDPKGRSMGFPGGMRVVDKNGKDLGQWFAAIGDHCEC